MLSRDTLKSKPEPKIGVDMFGFALLVGDDPGETPEYADTVMVPGTVNVGFNPNAQTSTFYADNVPYATAVQYGDLVVSVSNADIPPELRNMWFGHRYEGGVLEEGQLNAVEIAVAYRVKKANGAYRYFWLMKGKAAPPSESAETGGGPPKFQGDSITINCATLVSKGIFRRMCDDDDPNLPEGVTQKQVEEGWFSSPLWKPGGGEGYEGGGDGYEG